MQNSVENILFKVLVTFLNNGPDTELLHIFIVCLQNGLVRSRNNIVGYPNNDYLFI